MKNKFLGILVALSALFAAASTWAAPANNTLWTLSEHFAQPESAYYDGKTKTVYVSSVAGNPGEKDGNGWISRLDLSGKVLDAKWVSGLNAPKGMRSYRGVLWVSDIDQVVSIDLATAKILKRVPIKGAKFLNDLAIGPQGEVYVSDTMANRIYVIRNSKVSLFAEGPELEGPNGLLVWGKRLYVASWGTEIKADFSTKAAGHLYWIDLKTKKRTSASVPGLGHLDGLEQDAANGFYVSDWVDGNVFHVTYEGESKLILTGIKGAADLAYIPGKKLLLVPSMGESMLKAYTF